MDVCFYYLVITLEDEVNEVNSFVDRPLSNAQVFLGSLCMGEFYSAALCGERSQIEECTFSRLKGALDDCFFSG